VGFGMAEGFFDIYQKTKGRKAKADVPAASASEALTVSQVTKLVEKSIAAGVPATIAVRGEVSNVRQQSTGHLYFTLKDVGACLNCVMWREAAGRLKFKIADGVEMIATGRITVYPPQGRYQLRADTLQPVGQGALELAFRQLQEKLKAEGLFAPERKKQIPRYPRRIAMVTSKSTAALQDMLKVLRRFKWLKLSLYHVPVQGEGAGEKIAAAIAHLNQRSADVGGVDVILLARGGGSLEDLWAFNEEIVVRAVAGSKIPIITGVGHEIDTTIADLAADYHAHTPTEAAQIVTQHWKKAADELSMNRTRLRRSLRQIVLDGRAGLTAIERHEFFRRPKDRLQILGQILDDRQRAMSLAVSKSLRTIDRRMNEMVHRFQSVHPRHRLALARKELESHGRRLRTVALASIRDRRNRLDSLDHQLTALSPQAVLNRGYSITTIRKTGKILRSASEAKPGDRLMTRLADGEVESDVRDSKQLSLFE